MKQQDNKLLWVSVSFLAILLVIVLIFNVQLTDVNERLNKQAEVFNAYTDLTNENLIALEELILGVDQAGKEAETQILDIIKDVSEASEQAKAELERDIASIEVDGGDFSNVIDDSLESVVSVLTNRGQGSGVFVDNNIIVTNYHVIDRVSNVGVRNYDGDVFPVSVLGYSRFADVAVLYTNRSHPRLRFGDSDSVKVGSSVIALGNPLGLDFTVTQGIISARRDIDGFEHFQIDTAINPGNSGGPVIDATGKIIGIANAKIQGADGIGFAIPSEVVEDVVDQVLES